MKLDKKLIVCPLCEGERLEVRHELTTRYRYLGKDVSIEGQEHTVCNDCGFSFFADGQIERNSALFDALEARVVKGISPRKILELRQKYGITQAQAASIFKCAKRAFSKWERGEVAPAAAVANVLNLAFKNQEYMRIMADAAGEQINLMPSQMMVPHSEIVTLKDMLARRDIEDHVRRQEAYEAGRKEGLRQSYQIKIDTSRMVREVAFGRQIDSGDVSLELLLWQKEKLPLVSR